ncbi:MAG: N-acetylmuramoyl-L-alanine amidase [Eubacterium sp.]|nr:N-acetylmuramoyl-L-alanine amidase [Eubacterium sp.]
MNKYQKKITAIIVVMAMIISGTAVFVFMSCNKNDKPAETTKKETTTVVETTTVADVVLYTKDDANLREKPDVKSKSVKVLPKFTKVLSDGAEGEWKHIKYKDKVGYIRSDLLMDEAQYKKAEKESKKAAEKEKKRLQSQAKIKSANGSGKVICIDPGHQAHGNSSTEPIGPGASQKKAKVSSGTAGRASGLAEYQLNLQVALKLKSALESQGYQVVMTRETNDVNISNAERAQVANNANADAFLRIHANGGGAGQSGILTMCPTSGNPYCGKIASSSYKLSSCILDEMVKATGANKVGVSQVDNMTGMNWSKVPVTIIEMGFMTNAAEDKRMATDSYQKKLVAGICNGLADYFN